ncbi:sensor histidine kinase, partial [Paenibacillus sp. MCAF20]
LVACFLEIQKYRFGDKLNYTIHAEEGVLSTMIPKMTLQPLVENASIHGIEPLKEAGWIHIHIERRATGLAYTIKDNGVGIPQEKLAHMLAGLDKDDAVSDNVGMRNVYLRFKGFYGDKADFQIKSEPGQGTEITIVITENNDI